MHMLVTRLIRAAREQAGDDRAAAGTGDDAGDKLECQELLHQPHVVP